MTTSETRENLRHDNTITIMAEWQKQIHAASVRIGRGGGKPRNGRKPDVGGKDFDEALNKTLQRRGLNKDPRDNNWLFNT